MKKIFNLLCEVVAIAYTGSFLMDETDNKQTWYDYKSGTIIHL